MYIKILVPRVANLDNYAFFLKNILLNGLPKLFITDEYIKTRVCEGRSQTKGEPVILHCIRKQLFLVSCGKSGIDT